MTSMHLLIRVALLALLAFPAFGQSPATQENPPQPVAQAPESRLATPLGTIYFFLERMDSSSEERRREALQTFDAPEEMSEQDRWDTAVRLFGILNRLARRFDQRHAPEEKDGRAQFFPQAGKFDREAAKARTEGSIVLVPVEGRWLFSAATLNSVPALYEAMSALPELRAGSSETKLSSSLWLRGLMPAPLLGKFLTLEYWQWLGLFLIILLGMVLDFSVRAILRSMVGRILERVAALVSRDTVTRAVRPIGLCSAAFLWVALLPLIGLTGTTLAILQGAVALFAVLAGTWAAWRVIDVASEAALFKAEKTETKVDDILVPMFRKSVKIFIVIIGVIYAAESMSIEIAPLIASLGIGGLAFAFAAKDTIENFFGSIAVLVDRPFQVGDWIVVGDVEGIVEELGFRSTRVRTFYNSVLAGR
jgi:MscS family membrane protein